MTYITEFIQTVGPFFLLLGLLIFIHEMGHFAVAHFFGVRVEIFSIGFGKTIFKRKYGETEYRLSIFPLGGYVKMFGDNPTAIVPPDQQAYSFIHKPVFQRIAVVLAGPIMNLILAFFVFWGIGLYGEPQVAPVLGDIAESTAAYQAGLRSGDKVLTINNEDVKSFDDSFNLISKSSNDQVLIKVSRDGTVMELTVPTVTKSNPNILSSDRQIPQIDGWSMYSTLPTVGFENKNSDLYIAGLRPLDEIKKINNIKTPTQRDLIKVISSLPKDQEIELTVARLNAKGTDEDTLTFKASSNNLSFETTEKYIGRAQKGSPAEKAGMLRGDKILYVGPTPITKWEELIEAVKTQGSEGKPITFKVLRDFEEKEITVTPQMKSMMNEKGQETQRPIVGIEPGFYLQVPDQIYVPAGGLLGSLGYAKSQTWKWTVWTVNSVKRVVQGEVSHKNLGGFITIGQVAKESFKVGWSYFFQMMGIISINLFLLNLLPIPVLDGGHLVFYLIEALRGRPVSPKNMEIAFMFGFALLMSLVGLTLFNDIQRVFLSGW
jgi:regulator of sigma E protease